MKVKVVRYRDPIKEVTLTLTSNEAGLLKCALENALFNHKNSLGLRADQILYYPLKKALKGITCQGDQYEEELV